MLHLVLGGARSGKSSFAENGLLDQKKNNENLVYVATAQALDSEMKSRIEHHQQQRATEQWQLIECPLQLAQLVTTFNESSVVLIDCLTLWLSNQLMKAYDSISVVDNTEASDSTERLNNALTEQVDALITALSQSNATITLVSNEVGLGVIPMGKETRLFVDQAGWMNQKLAKISDQVTLVTAGIPLKLKPQGVNNG